ACGDGTPPTENEVTYAVGMRPGQVKGTTCVPAKGKSGFNCTFLDTYSGLMLTRHVVKGDDGWRQD
ncbi:MAG: hypothetical protein B7Y77_01335, partial [Bradyrhizobium sp. 35-63-5]